MAFDKTAFADKVRRTKEHLALTDAELAAGTGIPVQRLSILLSGQTDPTGDEVLILSDYFDCDYKFFISNEKLAAFEKPTASIESTVMPSVKLIGDRYNNSSISVNVSHGFGVVKGI